MMKYPYVRRELIFNIRALADLDYQRRVWVNHELPRVHFEDSLDMTFAALFDDMGLDTHLDQAIGVFLNDNTEVQAIQRVAVELDAVLAEMDTRATDKEYINSGRWPRVLQAAAQAYRLLTGGQEPEGMFEDLQRGWQPE
jgi:hypothetical protein